MSKVLIINHKSMYFPGGIQHISYGLTKFMLSHGVKVLWLVEKGSAINENFTSVLSHPDMSVVNVSKSRVRWFKCDKLPITETDEAVILSFTTINMVKADDILRRYSGYNIKSIYAVANTTGSDYYFDNYFKGWLHTFAKKSMEKAVALWNDNGQLCFCNIKQILPFEKAYNIKVPNKERRLVKAVTPPPSIDEATMDIRCQRDSFNIVTVGRFCFPHKGYMLGLVRAYGRLKPKYDKLRLTIIGSGPDEEMLQTEICKLPEEYRKGINLVGEVSKERLPDYFAEAHLNVSVAAAVVDGAKCGVVSIPARNYCTGECEVYGFLPGSKDMIVETCPGSLVDSFIIELIEMDVPQFRKLCLDSYNSFNDPDHVDPWWIFKVGAESSICRLKPSTKRWFIFLDYVKKMKLLISRQTNK